MTMSRLTHTLSTDGRALLRRELVSRVNLATEAAAEWRAENPRADPRSMILVEEKMLDATLAGFTFTIEEAHTARPTAPAFRIVVRGARPTNKPLHDKGFHWTGDVWVTNKPTKTEADAIAAFARNLSAAWTVEVTHLERP